MSLRPDGTYRCDKCNEDVDNGGVHAAVTIVGTDPANPGIMRGPLHLCLPRDVDKGNGETEHIPGCRDSVLTARALAAYHALTTPGADST